MPEIESLRLAVSTWAKLLPQVKIVWLFGSRANGTAKKDSDVDIAVELDDSAISGEDPFTYWHFESKNILSSLQSTIPFCIDFNQYRPDSKTHIPYFIAAKSIVLYEKISSQAKTEI